MQTLTYLFAFASMMCGSVACAQGQPVQANAAPPTTSQQGFESENAILDTSIPFVAGAREARQELRGSFGWSTFQEGQVNGVYFRFDPDGYARFSTTPRLDTDVFEVICRPRTLVCLGRKGGLTVELTPAGQIKIGLGNSIAGDRFFLSEGLTEVQLPDRILQPLDPQFEALLATGSELVIRRGDVLAERISLNGFFAVSAYLRWIMARQDYAALPRNWPVPSSNPVLASPQPLPAPVQNAVPTANSFDPLLNPRRPQGGQGFQSEVAEVRGELNMLRQLILDQRPQDLEPQRPENALSDGAMESGSVQQNSDARVMELERSNQMLMHELQRLRSMGPGSNSAATDTLPDMQDQVSKPWPSLPPATSMGSDFASQPAQPTPTDDNAQRTARQLEYLMSEIGLDAKTALLLIQSNNEALVAAVPEQGGAYQEALVADVLNELQEQMPDLEASSTVRSKNDEPIADEEYRLLAEYFKSVFDSDLSP